MAKKKNNNVLNKVLYTLVLVTGVATICMMFLTSFTVTGKVLGLSGTTEYTGIQATFGYTSNNVEYLGFSVMNLMSYVLVLAGVVLALLKLLGVMKGKLADYLMLCLFVVAGVFFFLITKFTVLTETYANAIDAANLLVKDSVTTGLGVGAILSGVLALVSALLVVVKLAVVKK